MIASLGPAFAAPAAAVAHGYGNGYGPGYHGGGFFLLGPLFALFWILVVWFVVGFFLRRSGRGPWGRWNGGPASAEAILHERYARGEVDVEEYQTRLEALRRARRG